MPIPGKEIEPHAGLDEVALREVEGYIERTEKQVETQKPVVQQTPSQTTGQVVQQDMGTVVSAQFAGTTQPKIVLPLNQKEIEAGLHHRIIDGVKWLAEWCVMMIKKYPGRVFYLPSHPPT